MRDRALTPESRLLLACAGSSADSQARAALVETIEHGVDWGLLLHRAWAEGVASLLHARLRELGASRSVVPGSVLERLAASYGTTWARNTLLTERWAEVMELLAQKSVESVTHKGMALIHTVYPDIALRPMADIDMLVRPADVEAVTRVLQSAGYRMPGDAAEEAFRGYRHFVRDSTVIDLHWELANYTRFESVVRVDHEGIWRRARRLDVGHARGLTLSPEDLLLHLVLHLSFGSEFGRLIWFVDIDATLRRFAGALEWERALEEAERWRIQAVLAYVLRVVRASFETPLPPGLAARLGRRRVRSALVAACIGSGCPPSLSGKLADSRVYLAETLLMDRLGGVLRILGFSFFPPRDWVRFHYSVTSWWQISLRRILHPVRVVCLAVLRLR